MLRDTLKIHSSDFDHVASGLFAYLFGLLNKQDYYDYIGDRVLARNVLVQARSTGYVLRDCKLFAHACTSCRHAGQKPPSPKRFGIERVDANFLSRLNLNTHQYKLWLPEQLDNLVARSLMSADMRAYIGKLISKKMIFLVNSYGVHRHDLESSLTSAALYAMYKQFPRYESALHAENICKCTIHNTAMNLIKHHTRGKRQALRRSLGGSFESVNVTLDAVMDVPCSTDHLELKDQLESLVALTPRMSQAVQDFLMISAGKFDSAFSEFLGVNNSDAVESMPYARYMAKVRTFLGVSEEQTENLFCRLRPHLE